MPKAHFNHEHPVGFYLDYSPFPGSHGPDGETVLVSCYFQPTDASGYMRSTVNRATGWCKDVASARQWIEDHARKALNERATSPAEIT